MKRFHHIEFQQNRTIFGLGFKILGLHQKWSDFAEIRCDEIFLWVDFTHQIWAKSDHFWQSWKITFWALTLSAHSGENWNITSVDLTYVKFQVIWSWNQLKNQNFHERKNFSSSLTLALLGYIGGVMPPYIPPWGVGGSTPLDSWSRQVAPSYQQGKRMGPIFSPESAYVYTFQSLLKAVKTESSLFSW